MRRRESKERGAPLRQLSDLFTVYKNRLQAPQRSVVQEAVKVVNDVTGFSLQPTQCSYNVKNRTLVISAPSALKQEILLRAPEILTKLEQQLGAKSAPHSII